MCLRLIQIRTGFLILALLDQDAPQRETTDTVVAAEFERLAIMDERFVVLACIKKDSAQRTAGLRRERVQILRSPGFAQGFGEAPLRRQDVGVAGVRVDEVGIQFDGAQAFALGPRPIPIGELD